MGLQPVATGRHVLQLLIGIVGTPQRIGGVHPRLHEVARKAIVGPVGIDLEARCVVGIVMQHHPGGDSIHRGILDGDAHTRRWRGISHLESIGSPDETILGCLNVVDAVTGQILLGIGYCGLQFGTANGQAGVGQQLTCSRNLILE